LKETKETVAFFPTPSSIVEYMITLSGAAQDNKILEAGFGDGAFLNVLNDRDFSEVTGVEYATIFAEEAKEKFQNFTIFHQDYLSFFKPGYFDAVVGNPPYINSDNLEPSVREAVRAMTRSGEGNIYYAFIIHSINNLKEGGTLTYILPYDFFFNTYADYLRKFMIRNGFFTDIIDFGESKIFKDAAPETIIFRYVKGKNKKNSQISVKQIKNLTLDVIEENLLNGFNDFTCYKQDQFTEQQDIWYLSNIKKIDGIKLKDISGIQVSVGIVNGNEEAFIIDKTLEAYKQLTKEEKKKFIKKFIKNKDRPLDSNEFYSGGVEYIFIDSNTYINTEHLKQEAPNIYSYLNLHREDLEKRADSKKNWFDYLAIRNKQVFEVNANKLKIHVPGLTRLEKQWFFRSKNDYYVGADLLTITLFGDEDKLQKIFDYLNSDDFAEYYDATGAKKGKRTVFTQNILANIVIPREIAEMSSPSIVLF
jgi:adenine-specific DNA-methyltransferase